MVVAGLVVRGASHFVGVGFILDIAAVVVIGIAVLKAFQVMWDIYKIITRTSKKTDLERAAKMMADMVIDIGVETFLAIVLKGAAKSRFRAPPSKATGSADEALEFAPARTRGGALSPRRKMSRLQKKKSQKQGLGRMNIRLLDGRLIRKEVENGNMIDGQKRMIKI